MGTWQPSGIKGNWNMSKMDAARLFLVPKIERDSFGHAVLRLVMVQWGLGCYRNRAIVEPVQDHRHSPCYTSYCSSLMQLAHAHMMPSSNGDTAFIRLVQLQAVRSP